MEKTEGRKYRQESDYDKRPIQAALKEISASFDAVGGKHGLSADEEFAYVWTILSGNLSLMEMASKNPDQLKRALLTGAGIGLTLDPARQYAYLTVRRGKLIYDIGYRGLIKLAVDEGLVRHVKAELVHQKDRFEYRGPRERPLHTSADFFGDRGPIVGGYCEAVLPDGSIVIETMRESEFKEIAKLNADSDAWKRDFSSGEMRKKTLVKRAAKWWYNSAGGQGSARVEKTIAYLNNEAGDGIAPGDGDSAQPEPPKEPRVYTQADVSSPGVEKKIAEVVARAVASGAWQAARQYFESRLKGDDLGYAMQELNKAQSSGQAQESAQAEPAAG